MSKLQFESTVISINSHKIVRIPLGISSMLPSRGMAMVKATVNNQSFTTPLEPDGKGSHWFPVTPSIRSIIGADIGNSVHLEVEMLNDWAKPALPDDLNSALVSDSLIKHWDSLTAKYQWSWVRWIRFTSNPLTRKKRLGTLVSMLANDKKTPCCFDYSRCTVTDVSKSGVLLCADKT